MNREAVKIRDQRFVALAALPCISLAEIGRRLGITREWARRLNNKHGGLVGKDRRKVCVLDRNAQEFQQSRAGRFGLECEKRGLIWEPFMLRDDRLSVRRVMVNGYRVVTCAAHRYKDTPYIQARTKTIEKADFFAYTLPDGGWLILPGTRTRYTMFSLNPDPRYGAKTDHHDYGSFVDNFDQMRSQ